MHKILIILLVIAMAATVAVLATGVIGMGRSGPKSGSRSNRLMQARIVFQTVAILLFVLVMWFSGR
jgi:Mn2+/Fe2+ NRAMP family transporter